MGHGGFFVDLGILMKSNLAGEIASEGYIGRIWRLV